MNKSADWQLLEIDADFVVFISRRGDDLYMYGGWWEVDEDGDGEYVKYDGDADTAREDLRDQLDVCEFEYIERYLNATTEEEAQAVVDAYAAWDAEQ